MARRLLGPSDHSAPVSGDRGRVRGGNHWVRGLGHSAGPPGTAGGNPPARVRPGCRGCRDPGEDGMTRTSGTVFLLAAVSGCISFDPELVGETKEAAAKGQPVPGPVVPTWM